MAFLKVYQSKNNIENSLFIIIIIITFIFVNINATIPYINHKVTVLQLMFVQKTEKKKNGGKKKLKDYRRGEEAGNKEKI